MVIQICQGGEFYAASTYNDTALYGERQDLLLPQNRGITESVSMSNVVADLSDPQVVFRLNPPHRAFATLNMKRLRLHL